MHLASSLRLLALTLTCFEICLESSFAIPRKYLTGEEDPPSCDGDMRTNPFPGQCGQRKGNFDRKRRDGLNSGDIIGGRGVSRGEFPWFVDMGDCGATIADELTLITAAHCFDDGALYNGTVIAGSKHPMEIVKQSFDSAVYCGAQLRRIVRVVLHPKYCSTGEYDMGNCATMYEHDVAIVTVNRPFVFNGVVQRVCLPDETWNLNPGTELQVLGNGVLDYEDRIYARTLQAVVVPIIAFETCKKMLGRRLTEDMLCAGHEQGGKDGCLGDSGGPLLLTPKTTKGKRSANGDDDGIRLTADEGDDNGDNNEDVTTRNDQGNGITDDTASSSSGTALIGVVSWGINCADPKYPGVYARMNDALPWIKSLVQIQTSKLLGHLRQDMENTSSTLTRRNGLVALALAMAVAVLTLA